MLRSLVFVLAFGTFLREAQQVSNPAAPPAQVRPGPGPPPVPPRPAIPGAKPVRSRESLASSRRLTYDWLDLKMTLVSAYPRQVLLRADINF